MSISYTCICMAESYQTIIRILSKNSTDLHSNPFADIPYIVTVEVKEVLDIKLNPTKQVIWVFTANKNINIVMRYFLTIPSIVDAKVIKTLAEFALNEFKISDISNDLTKLHNMCICNDNTDINTRYLKLLLFNIFEDMNKKTKEIQNLQYKNDRLQTRLHALNLKHNKLQKMYTELTIANYPE